MSSERKRKIWWLVSVSASVVFFFAYLAGIDSQIKLNRALDDARANGFPVDPEDIFTKPVPKDEDNAAIFYEQMVQLEEPTGYDYEVQSRHGDAHRTGYTDFDREKVLAYLKANSELIELAEKATEKPDYWADKDWTNPVTVTLQELKLSKDASKAFASRALFALESGDVSAALDDLQRILTIARHMENAGFTIVHLVAFSDRLIYYNAVELMSVFPAADEEFFRGVLEQLAQWPTSTNWTEVLRLEAYTSVWIPQNIYEPDSGHMNFLESNDGWPQDDYDWERLSWQIPRTRSNAALLALEHWTEVLDTYDPSSPDPLTWARGIDAKTVTGSGFWHGSEVLAMNFVVPLESAIGAGISDSARREVLQSSIIALLAKRSGRDYASDGLLTDPWTKSDLQFIKTTDSFLIYSVGQNGIDDGGDKLKDNDIVFEFPLSRKPAPAGYYYN